MEPYPYAFEGQIDRFGVGKTRKVWYTVVFLPADIAAELPFAQYPRLRIDGEIADLPVAGAWMPTGDGRRYFIVAPRILRGAAVGAGDLVEMRFGIADQTAMDMPDALVRALSRNDAAAEAWNRLTPGKRRGMTHRVHAARTEPTRERRAAEIIVELMK